jgi:hypothetical protein
LRTSSAIGPTRFTISLSLSGVTPSSLLQ